MSPADGGFAVRSAVNLGPSPGRLRAERPLPILEEPTRFWQEVAIFLEGRGGSADVCGRGHHPRPCAAGGGAPLRQEVLRVVGFVSLPDEHAPSVKYRVRRVLHAQRTDPMKPPRSAPPAGVGGAGG